MSERAADNTESPVRAREKNLARAAILDAARRVANREGIEGTSLGLVADEAGVARAAVYALFRSKNDLFLSIVADDLNLLAQTMREAQGLPPYKPATPSKIVRFDTAQMEAFRNAQRDRSGDEEADVTEHAKFLPGANEEAQDASDASFAPLVPDMVRVGPKQDYVPEQGEEADAERQPTFRFEPALPQMHQAEAAPSENAEEPKAGDDAEMPADETLFESAKPLEKKLPTKGERIRLVGKRALATPELKETMKRLSPTHSPEGDAQTETISKLQDSLSKLEGGIAEKLERRVQMIERAIAALESRHEKSDQTTASATGTVQDALGKLVNRIDDSEKRLRDSMVKMMAEVRDASRRVDVIEFGKASAAADAAQNTPDFGVTPEEFASIEDDAQRAAEPEQDAGDEHPETAQGEQGEESAAHSAYLYSARRSAQSAAIMAQEFVAADVKRKSQRTKTLLIGVGGLAVVLVLAGVALKRLSAPPAPDVSVPITASATTHRHVAHLPKHLTFAVAHPRPMLASATGTPPGSPVLAAAPLDHITALANSGNTNAELMIGLKYLSGDGVARNDVEAEKWISRAATQNNAVAQYWMGSLFQHGRGVAADPAQALAWYEKAAAQGNRKAMHNLAIAYADGHGVPKDFMIAARWFSQAAQLGYVDSQFNLAVLYERGDGVPQSLLDAYKWYAIAAAQGDAESKSRMDAIATQLSADDLAAAQKAAQSFKPQDARSATNDVPREALLLAQ